MPLRTFKNISPQLGKATYIDSSAVIIGDVTLADHVSVWPTAVIRGDVSSISIGAATNIQDGSILHVSHAGKHAPAEAPLKIGKGVTIGHRAVVHACTVGDYCLIGIGAIIMDNAVLEDYVMLGAGALVPPGKVLQSGYLYIGSPAKKTRALSDSEREFLEYSSAHYVQLKNEYLEP
ncbi:MAG: gamma carbonic anhydrase family protein [Gammaproteobacteria bacterium]|jgi:carbonic anhydrase/acetyltransferase-like protein (isoleucine patch superfamily)|uniref:gamma carbonic anhydrase family protein n=1 Tax=Methyloprofundus sp. TaxID=2020875 RepID=UPI001803CAC5|nr:gamma carbonic anhydrase family protein [Methyloprofundus sp.]MBT3813614.1 gamma carbonic anhydrase family protein [Gammaproteobacteria bacterium]HIL78430.1 gamma carbonic anhydrase family protein [Methylococcales bacterium]MBT4145280.1 gamma carbonic anhydrase family protein [Gammaproteobacteria bacterium]MBT5222251.1 gamma carbonic anhydrase family protein [Gammaproteobacteria bacterium]MBT5826728.1 gamma carbonic anhydrase family protein [Gammaproteobacteria bacterium]